MRRDRATPAPSTDRINKPEPGTGTVDGPVRGGGSGNGGGGRSSSGVMVKSTSIMVSPDPVKLTNASSFSIAENVENGPPNPPVEPSRSKRIRILSLAG